MYDENLVIKSNPLIISKSNLNIQEQKLVIYVISLIQQGDEDFEEYIIKAGDYAEIMHISINNVYRDFRSISKGILSKPIFINRENGDTLIVNWFSSCVYNEGKGSMTIKLSPELAPYLLDLKRNFTRYYLKNILRLKSKYSVHLYEFFKMQQYKRAVEVTLEVIESLFNGLNYKKWADLRRYVIDPSIKEINEKTDIFVGYDVVKTGRRVSRLKFIIQDSARMDSELYGNDNVEW